MKVREAALELRGMEGLIEDLQKLKLYFIENGDARVAVDASAGTPTSVVDTLSKAQSIVKKRHSTYEKVFDESEIKNIDI